MSIDKHIEVNPLAWGQDISAPAMAEAVYCALSDDAIVTWTGKMNMRVTFASAAEIAPLVARATRAARALGPVELVVWDR